ncbi:glucuronate isomerase [Ketogulonicigenium vulgare]|uniref:glucuronate isomerase n=1 Tax=Ketogulonicigenium vulgare TaxID=92945 RepID=UPI00235964C1|nr:glucuronate isomerase [Ketogulonicigenium vulgare]
MSLLHPDRLFPANPASRDIARDLFQSVQNVPIISPHGHTDPRWYAEDAAFTNASDLLLVPDHYVLRMLVSQGVKLEDLGVAPLDGGAYARDPRKIWQLFAAHYHLFAGTPTRLWMDHTFQSLFGMQDRLTPANADLYFDTINESLTQPEFRPRALFQRFNIEVISTTESALDDLRWHQMIKDSGWNGRVVTTYRPDSVTDPDFEGFAANLDTFGDLTGCDTGTWQGYLDAHRARRAFFKTHGATASDHGHPSAQTANLDAASAAALYGRIRTGRADAADRALFRAQMLTEMAKMSRDDGLVMQLHVGSSRNHAAGIFQRFGRDKGFDIPARASFTAELQPLLDVVGLDPSVTIILFTLDESNYTRELAPLAGAYPALRLGPAWWFHDSAEGMRRYRQMVTETAGFYNTVGFNDDTRAFPSIPARHDVARRVDAAFLADLVADHRLDMNEAEGLMQDLTYGLAKKTYRL